MPIFTPQQREQIRRELVEAAERDPLIAAAAHTGSAASGRLDRWSDIDLALAVAAHADADRVLADWTERLYRDYGAVTHHDVWRGSTRFRVFLLENTLQVDIAFWAAADFGAIGPAFQLVFGSANERPSVAPSSPDDLIGMAWLYALHVRSSAARGRLWQAEYMVSGMRDHVLALACLRYGLPVVHGRGLDDLPAEVKRRIEDGLVRRLDRTDIQRAFRAMCTALLIEIAHADTALAERLRTPLTALVGEEQN